MKKTIIIILAVVFISLIIICNLSSNDNSNNIQLLSYEQKIKLKVPEPSGLFFDEVNNSFWTVSDEDSTVYQLTSNGKIKSSFKVKGWDLEGITQINDSIFATILERSRTVVFVDPKGKELKRFNMELYGKPNEGLEGIAFNSNKNSFYLVNEKNPGLLIVTDTNGYILEKINLNFAPDFSGLWYDNYKNELWIISDEAKSIFRCKTDGSLIEQYKIDIKQIEGIAIDRRNSKLFIISDILETLFIFNLP